MLLDTRDMITFIIYLLQYYEISINVLETKRNQNIQGYDIVVPSIGKLMQSEFYYVSKDINKYVETSVFFFFFFFLFYLIHLRAWFLQVTLTLTSVFSWYIYTYIIDIYTRKIKYVRTPYVWTSIKRLSSQE